ncbi:MAG: hypothetical protein KAX44_01910 [Candidatus Brocadiae bacterium]|nr:hypothetical protein [Candidatus Brocadiia bacterium]
MKTTSEYSTLPDEASGELRICTGVFLLTAAVGLTALGWQVFHRPSSLGGHDWSYFFHVYEAVRISIVHYGQFPWWNIWSCGGVPLFANPQVGVFSINTLFVLLFGTVFGLKLSLGVHVLFGFEGMRRLLRRYITAPFALLGALIYVAGGGFAMHWAVGHFILLTSFYLPWLLLLALRLPDGDRYAWLFGLLMGLMVLEGVGYTTVFNALVAAIAGFCVLIRTREKRLAVARRIAMALGVFLVVAGFRLAMSMVYVSQYAGTSGEEIAVLGRHTAKAFLTPIADIHYWRSGPQHFWWEYGCYVGVPVAVLFGFSFARGIRYWHCGALLCLLSAYSATFPGNPFRWLGFLPFLGAIRVLTRWRLVALLFIGMGAAVGAEALWSRMSKRWMRLAAVAFCALAALEVTRVSATIISVAFPAQSGTPSVALPAEPGYFYHVRPSGVGNVNWMYRATRANVGVVEGYEPLLGYDRRRAIEILAVSDEGYRGEAVADGTQVQPAYWSPNRLVFERVNAPLRLNLAPGSYWRVNGRDLFGQMRVTELTEPFVVRPDESGRVTLTIVPEGWRLGLGLIVAGLMLLGLPGITRLVAERLNMRPSSALGGVES